MEIVLLSFLSLLLLLLILPIRSKSRQLRRLPPSPPSRPIIGHLHLFKKPLHRALTRIASIHGPIVHLQFGSRPVLLVSSPQITNEIFTAHDVNFANRPKFPSAKHTSNNYTTFVSSSYGPNWRNLRRIATVEILSTHRLMSSANVRSDEVLRLVRRLFISSGSENKFTKLDLRISLFELVLNVVMRMIAGKRYYGEESEDSKEAKIFRNMVKEGAAIAGASNLQDFFPILRLFDFGGVQKRAKKLSATRNELSQKLIDELREKSFKEKIKEKTMIGDLLQLQKSEPEVYTDVVIRSLCLSIVQAGTDTSSNTMEWAMSLLLNHPSKLLKCQMEIDEIVGFNRLISESDLQNLKYLECVINETMRLCPVVPLLVPHESSEECEIGGFRVPGGTMLLVDVYKMHRDEDVWEEANEFKPERFEDGKSGNKFMRPFGMGRRGCPGETLAKKLIGLTIGTLIQCFDWVRLGDGKQNLVDMTEGSGITMPRAVPLVATYRPRTELVPLLTTL